VLFDLPPVIADAAASGPVAASAGRCDLVAGDFFTTRPFIKHSLLAF